MYLHALSLRQFRNYGDLALTFSPYKNLFVGKNGQGKTNLLEAVYILSHTYSHRTNKERELIQHGEPFATLQAEVVSQALENTRVLAVHYATDPQTHRLKTVFKTNGTPAKSRSQFLGDLPTVSFFVSDLLLLRGTPEDRRYWLDAAVSQYDKRHLYDVTQYQKIRTQKNRLLKEPPESISLAHLAVWNEQLAQAAAKVTANRMAYLSRVYDQAMLTYLELSGGEETLTLQYQSRVLEVLAEEAQVVNQTVYDPLTLEAAYQTLLERRQSDELRRGLCLVGPHRDDIQFFLNARDAHSFGSQGQQRTIILALKLTELSLLSQKLGETPVLLLDDVMAELDLKRQRYLIEHLPESIQVLLSTTHVDHGWHQLFKSQEERIFKVNQGQVERVEETEPTQSIG